MSPADLTQPGSESEMRCRASGVEFTLRSKPVLIDFAGTCRLTAGVDEHGSMHLRLAGLRLTAELPDAGGPEDGGTITLVQGEDAVLHPSSDVPSRSADNLVLALGVTVVQPGGLVRAESRDTAKFVTTKVSYPSGDGDYELVDPVDMVLPDAPEVTIAQLHTMILHVEPA